MKDNLFICLFIILISAKYGLSKVQYSDSYIAVYDGPVDEKNFKRLEEYGFVLDMQIDIGPGFYRFIRNGTRFRTRLAPPKTINLNNLQRKDPQLLSFRQERLWFREKKSIRDQDVRRSNSALKDIRFNTSSRTNGSIIISDRYWHKQWQLNPSHMPSMGVYNAWASGFTGKGITVAVVDDGIDVSHIDLRSNYNAALSYDIIYSHPDPSHVYKTEGHGTKCAGVVAAVKNTYCVIGTAYEASVVAIRVVDDLLGATDSQEASAIVHQLASIDIYSNSWGARDDGKGFDSFLSDIQQGALLKGVTHGRGGKGAIYVWAAGNGGQKFDDCNVDGFPNSIYTIAVNSLAPDSSPAYYAEECTSVLVATYGGDDRQATLATTHRGDTCVDDFQGTSAACPAAAGIIALVLQANPELTWRDMQYMIVEFSTNTGLKNANFYINGAGKKVSLSHGFGLMNASLMVNAASSWKTVPDNLVCEESTSQVYRSRAGKETILSTYTVNDCNIKYLEHVVVHIYFQSDYRNYTSIYLESPNGTNSRLLRERHYDTAQDFVTWEFMSVHTWGENPTGTWTLRMQSSYSGNRINLYTWRLRLYGTATDLLLGRPPKDTNSNIGVIVGAVFGGIGLCIVVAVLAVIVRKKKCRPSTVSLAPTLSVDHRQRY